MLFDIEVNSRTIQARKGETILVTLNRNGINVPTLCSMKGLSPTGACRICAVEVEGVKNLVTACSTIVEEGMKISTHSPRVVKARKILVELLLSNHPDDCLYCERNGNCELQDLSIELNIRERRISGHKSRHKLDFSSPCLVRDPAKCILCGRCVRICDEIQSVAALEFINRGCKTTIGTTMNLDINLSSCIGCGQCVMVCPTAALNERTNIEIVQDALNSKSLKVAVQLDPVVSVSLSQELGLKPSKDVYGLLVAALKRMGFSYVFDTSFTADLMLMETIAELKNRMETGENLPMISSFCPAFVRFVEQFHPKLLPLLSTCKSPQQMMGSLINSYLTVDQKLSANSIVSVSVTPCLARKLEASRSEMAFKNTSEVNAVLSTRELSRLIKLYGIDIQSINPKPADSPFGKGTSSGKLFSNAGGISEAMIRSMHYELTGKELSKPKLNDFRSLSGIKEVDTKVGSVPMKVLLSSGLSQINDLLLAIEAGDCKAQFVEVMACPGGCVNGGGQPFGNSEKDIKLRAKSIYDLDEAESIKVAHKNSMLSELYNSFLEKPGSDKAKELLHVKYSQRDVLL